MKTKEEVIKEAYGVHFDYLKDFIWMSDGYCQDRRYNQLDCPIPENIRFNEPYESEWIRSDNGEEMVDVFRWRPKSLQGIEDNNGWIRIESEEDLPKDSSTEYHFYDFKAHERIQALQVSLNAVPFSIITNLYSKGLCTHYRPILKHKPPIY